MAVPVTQLHILRVMLQADQNLSGLQKDMRQNAQTWLAMAQAQSPDMATLAGFMNSAAASYQTRLAWVSTIQADGTNWPKIQAMAALLGIVAADFSSVINPLTAVANQLGPADKSTFAAIITACNSIIAAIPAPLSLWPE